MTRVVANPSNPYLDEFNRLQSILNFDYRSIEDVNERDLFRRQVLGVRQQLVRKFAWAIPNQAALETIARYAPVVEIAAGAGYWASLLRAMGVVVHAYDYEPRPSMTNGYRSQKETPWTIVRAGSFDVLELHQGETLFLCWPPYGDTMDYEAIVRHMAKGGRHVILVGIRQFKHVGSREGFDLLAREHKLVEEVDIPTWPEADDKLMVFERN